MFLHNSKRNSESAESSSSSVLPVFIEQHTPNSSGHHLAVASSDGS